MMDRFEDGWWLMDLCVLEILSEGLVVPIDVRRCSAALSAGRALSVQCVSRPVGAHVCV